MSPPEPLDPDPAKVVIIPDGATLRSLLEWAIYTVPVVSPHMALGVGIPAEVAWPPFPEKAEEPDPVK